MQWLNKVDDALDWVLGPAGGGEEEGDGDEIARAAAEAVQSSTQSTSIDNIDRPTSLPQHGIATSTIATKQSTSAKKKDSVLIDIENSTPAGSPQKKKNDTTISSTTTNIISNKQPPLPSAPIRKSPKPPPPPPKYTTPTKKNVSITACPSTPLATSAAMLSSEKVLDDSHHVSNNDILQDKKVDVYSSTDGNNEVFVTAKNNMISSLPLNAAKKAAESTIIQQQQATHQTPVKLQQQAEFHQLDMTTSYSSSSRSRIYSNTEQDQKAPTSPLEHLAISSRSPAPKKVIMRGRSSNKEDITNSDSTDENIMETSDDIKVGIPPPPPLPVFKEVEEDVVVPALDDSDRAIQQQPQAQQQQHKQQNVQRNVVPKSPSNFIIELPIQQQQGSDGQQKDDENEPSPMKMPRNSIPLPPPLWNKHPGTTTSNYNNNNRAVSQQQQQSRQRPTPRSAVTTSTRRRVVRPTPGVIRRRIRDPSLSPPDSPSSSSSSTSAAENVETGADNMMPAPATSTISTTDTTEKELPLQSVTLDNNNQGDVDRGISDLRMSELSVAPDIKKDHIKPPPPPPPLPTSDMDKSIPPPSQSKVDKPTNVDKTVSDVSSDDWNDNKKSSPTPVVVPPPSPSPVYNNDDHITPITQNRKSSSVVQQRKTTLSSDLTFDDELKTKENAADLNVLTNTKNNTHSPAESSQEEEDKKEEVSSSNEGVADTITNWFSRMGSTDGGGKNDKSKDDDKKDHSDDEDSFHSQQSNDDSELTGSNEADDFAIPSPSYNIQIQQQNDLSSWDSSLNRYGFFHVRLLRAQRLPCAPGSSINTTLSLQPWTGRIVIPTYVTSDGPRGAGVCLRWDKPFDQKKKQRRRGGGSKGGSSKDGESPEAIGGEEINSHSMVHAYNNEDTPVPTIYLELTISTLGGLRDSYMCSVSIPCHELLRNPRSWTHKWHPISLTQGSDQPVNSDVGDTTDTLPLILLETCFEPKETRTTAETVDETEQLVHISEDDTLGSIPQVIRQTTTVDDESVLTSTIIPRNPKVTKSHLLRVKTFWTPAWCAVCSKSLITGWSSGKSFECEACSIFCCRDCQLQVDARIPCGSELATIAVKKAQQYQIPSFGDIMTKVAPKLDEEQDKTSSDGVGESKQQQLQRRQSSLSKLKSEGRSIEGIGIMNIRVLRACLFDKTFPSEAEPSELFKSDYNLRNGDHYVRVSWLGSKETKRTKTVLQTPKPRFDSEEMIFDVPHYGMEYKLEVIDANTDRPIGSCLLSAQGLLQWQRDELLAKKERLLLSFLHLKRYSEPRRIKLELRTGVKDGFGLNFYNSAKSADGPNKQRPGEISGWLELDVHLEEDRQLFYSATPRRCPDRAEEEFDIALIQLHIARITAIFESMQKMVSTYMYIVGWEDQRLTGGSLVTFVVLTLGFNIEYLGSLPVGCLALYMMRLAYLRVTGQFKDRWTLQEKEALIKSETKIEKNQSIFRPLGLLHVGDLQGKNLRSRDLGLPGSFYASIMYDPLRYAPSDKMKATLIKMDSSSGCTHEVGTTISPGITSNPVWEQMQESTELMRLKHLLPDDRIWGQKEDMDTSLSYPILQPLTDGSFISNDDADVEQAVGLSLMPWEQSFGAVVIQVRFSDVLGMELFDNTLGEVVIPLAKLAGSGRAVEGWFRLLSVGTTDTIPGEESPDESAVELEGEESETESEEGKDSPTPVVAFPELYVNIKFSSNALDRADGMSLSDDMESFKVICEEMSRTASIAQSNSIGVIGSSLNTINTVRTLGGKLQNQISVVVDMVERVRNAFNFSNPRITVFIFLCLSLLWVVLAFIPTRIVILFGGLGQFGATYYMKFMMKPTKKKTIHMEKSGEEESSSTNIGNPLENLFLSIPTDEDLRRTYFWEARRLGEKEREKFASTKRQTRLDKLWKAKWHGALEIKERRGELQPESSMSERTWGWEPAFGLIEGHRFIWWRSERHFDTGEAPLGQIFFAGHSGLAGLSPLDLRELSKEEIPKVVSIFGRGTKEQQKITFLAPSAEVKDSLENAVIDASMNAKVD